MTEIPSFVEEGAIIVDGDDEDEYGLHYEGEFVNDSPF